ncbi:Uncharacterized protein APZ42_017253 [Daphnia magna]|uniref:Secreted protein n=1 Tax=Daphnia magna TaxID=35525 RepID=A0A164ZQB9_9CRUS|nr:Uncharacterized protein APZ42_017253 [Daphnia magna]
MKSVIALLLLLTKPTGNVAHSSTTTNQILQCRMFRHWTNIRRNGRPSFVRDYSGRWRLGSFELLYGRNLFIRRRMMELLEQLSFEIRNGGSFDQSDRMYNHFGLW